MIERPFLYRISPKRSALLPTIKQHEKVDHKSAQLSLLLNMEQTVTIVGNQATYPLIDLCSPKSVCCNKIEATKYFLLFFQLKSANYHLTPRSKQ